MVVLEPTIKIDTILELDRVTERSRKQQAQNRVVPKDNRSTDVLVEHLFSFLRTVRL